MGSWVIGPMIDAIIKWFAGMIVGGLNILWDLLAATAFTTPDVTVLTEVKSIASTSLAVVNTVYVLAILWMAILILGRDTIQSRYGLSELIPRLIIGLIAANLAMPLCSQLIGLVIAVMVGMLLMQWIVRIGILIVAVGVAPIALALHGTPHTEPAAKLWWRTILGALATVLIQAVALHTTLTVFLSPNADLPLLGLPGSPGATMKLMVVMCLLWTILKVPSMMRRYVSKSSPSSVGTIVRVMLVHQLTRAALADRALPRPDAERRRPAIAPACDHPATCGRADAPNHLRPPGATGAAKPPGPCAGPATCGRGTGCGRYGLPEWTPGEALHTG